MKFCKLSLLFSAPISLCLSGAAFSSDLTRVLIDPNVSQKIDACRKKDDRLQRLECFDKLFVTPIKVQRTANATSPAKLSRGSSAPERSIERLARSVVNQVIVPSSQAITIGTTTFDPWALTYRKWGSPSLVNIRRSFDDRNSEESTKAVLQKLANAGLNSSEDYDVFIATPQIFETGIGPPPKPAVLFLSCQNDITTLHLVLPSAFLSPRAPVQVASLDRQHVSDHIWQDIENNKVYIAGRGLESIGIMRLFSQFTNMEISLGQGDQKKTFNFNTRYFERYMKVIRTACHW